MSDQPLHRWSTSSLPPIVRWRISHREQSATDYDLSRWSRSPFSSCGSGNIVTAFSRRRVGAGLSAIYSWRQIHLPGGSESARGIANLLHALDIGIRDIRQILNPLRDIRHALNRREVQAERPSRPEKICAVIRRQVVKRPRGSSKLRPTDTFGRPRVRRSRPPSSARPCGRFSSYRPA